MPSHHARNSALILMAAALLMGLAPGQRPTLAQSPSQAPSATWTVEPPTATPPAATSTATATDPAYPPTATASATVTALVSPTSSTPLTPTVAAPAGRPLLIVAGFNVDPGQPAPGGAFTLNLNVANVGNTDARKVQISLASETFLPAGQGSVLYTDRIRDGREETLGTTLVVAQAAAPGVHGLAIELRYEDREGNAYADRASIGIQVASGGARRPQVIVAAVTMPSRVAPGIPFTLGLDLVNSGSLEARNLVVAPEAGPLAFQGGGGSTPLNLAPGAGAHLALRLVAASPSQPGAASQTLGLGYSDPEGVAYAATHVVGVVITGGAATDPLPMVVGYRAGRQLTLNPGQVFELELDISNVGVADALRTVLALGGGAPPASSGSGSGASGGSTGSALGVFAPLETSNVRYLGRLPAGGNTSLSQRMVVDGAAKPGPYVLQLTFSYVDANGQALSNTEVISLIVTRPISLAINALAEETTLRTGLTQPYPIEILNQGASSVSVTNAEVSGPKGVTVVEGTRFVGILDSGASDTLEPLITADEAGEIELRIAVHYLDDLNHERTVTEVFTLTVEAAPIGPSLPGNGSPRPSDSLVRRLIKGFLGLGAEPAGPPPSAIGTSVSGEAPEAAEPPSQAQPLPAEP